MGRQQHHENQLRQIVPLNQALVLYHWLLRQFGVVTLDQLAPPEFRRSVYEGYNEKNESHFLHYLLSRRYTFSESITETNLRQWDANIVGHSTRIGERRVGRITWKYFQYLSLLFTEFYLDRFFHDKKALLTDLNAFVSDWNSGLLTPNPNQGNYRASDFKAEDLNKIAFWSATGSGKTLLMHVNLLQYQHYLHLYDEKHTINKVLLVTPNEGLSIQHQEEFSLSGLDSDLFSKQAGGLFAGQQIEIIEISKLADDTGDKTVAIETFETNNLVLIDEGHRGVAGDQWKERRDYLSKTGFAFEYSATFGQAVNAAGTKKKKELLEEYGKSILFDYSYKYFYEDGYGKDYSILNISEQPDEDFQQLYLTGALLSFFQQGQVLAANPGWRKVYQIEKPLWIFVGSKVNAVRTENKHETSDVTEIIRFIGMFVKERSLTIKSIHRFLRGEDGILDPNGNPIFDGRLTWLQTQSLNAGMVYDQILDLVFHSTISGAEVYADLLKSTDGEIGLRVGESRYFGVINVGDSAKLIKLLRDQGIKGEEREFGNSLFQTINQPDSSINLLVGSKKFSEGWSSWRVSTMGLMNVGAGEGSQIIQLFGRGVRLKGYQNSLKRSLFLDPEQRPAGHNLHSNKTLRYLSVVETLQIFGIRANYMQQFKEFLEAEGLKSNEAQFVSIDLPAIPTVDLGTVRLKVLQVKGDANFKGEPITLAYTAKVGRETVRLEWYPRVQVLTGNQHNQGILSPETQKLNSRHWAFIDWKRVYFDVQQFKNERGYFNLSIPPDCLPDLIQNDTWYQLIVPSAELEADTFKKVREWQQIITALLKGYVERFYNLHKAQFHSTRMETVELTPNHPNFFEFYRVEIEKSRQDIIDKVKRLGELLKSAPSTAVSEKIIPGFTAFQFLNHLYKPLLYLDKRGLNDLIRVSPVSLETSEKQFIEDLKRYFENNPAVFSDKHLFVLRNASRKGIGFFEAHGFYPDFIVWLVAGEHQFISFVDPKGLRQINGLDNPKIRFHHTIKTDVEPSIRMKDPMITLNSFIVTLTPFEDVRHWRGGDRLHDFNRNHVFFMKEQQEEYIGSMLEMITST